MSIPTPPLKNLKDTRWTSNNMCKTSERNCRKFCNKISRLIDQDQMSHSLRKSWMLFQECSENILQFVLHSLTKNKLQHKSTFFFKSTMYKTKKHFSLESTHRITTVLMSFKARNIWVKVGLYSLAKVKDQECVHGFNSRQRS